MTAPWFITLSVSNSFLCLNFRVSDKCYEAMLSQHQLVLFPYSLTFMGLARKATSTTPPSDPYQNLNSKFLLFLKSAEICHSAWDISLWGSNNTSFCCEEAINSTALWYLRLPHNSALWLPSSYFPGKHFCSAGFWNRRSKGKNVFHLFQLSNSAFSSMCYWLPQIGLILCVTAVCVKQLS